MPRSTKPQISFADWELLQQGIVLEPLLQNISDFLDDHEELIDALAVSSLRSCAAQSIGLH